MKQLLAGLVAIAATLALILIAVAPAAATDSKWYVCKYVGTPGDDERLQGGDNPISVGGGSLPDPVIVGTFFNDSQGRSYILAENVGQPEPDPSECPPPDTGGGTPTPVPPTPTPVPPTPTPEGPTPTPAEPTPTPVIGEFSAAVAPCPLREGGTVNLLGYIPPRVFAAVIPDGQSGIRFKAALLFVLLHVRIDGAEVFPDAEGDVIVAPGLHEWSISNLADTEVLASGELSAPACNAVAAPTDTPPASDTENGRRSPGAPLALLLVLLAGGAAGAVILAPRKR